MFKKTSLFLSTLLFCSALLCGNEANQAPIGQRSTITAEKEELLQSEEVDQEVLNATRTEHSDSELRDQREAMAQFRFNRWIHAEHTAIAFGVLNHWVKLEDGTQLVVPFSERDIVAEWLPGDLLHVLPSSGWFWNRELRLHNVTTDETIQVDLSGGVGPLIDGPYSLYISAIDDNEGLIYLQNGSILLADSRDLNKLKKWEPGDYVITGCNDDWVSYRSPNILINVATINTIRVCPL